MRAIAAALLASAVSCTNAAPDAGPPKCVQGTVQACPCGTQTCLADGTFGACVCGPADASDDAPSGDADVDTSTPPPDS